MNARRLDLEQLQRWTQAVITHPGGVRQGVASEAAQDLIDVASADLEKVVTRSKQLTGKERLSIYARAYNARLLECMRAEYPCLEHFLGRDLFDRFVYEYLQAHPPGGYTLQQLGAKFAEHLSATRPQNDVGGEPANPWPDLVVDLARLERAVFEVYDGPGLENEPLPCVETLRATPANERPSLLVTLAPCLRLLAFRFPVRQYYREVRRRHDAETPVPGASYVAVTRREFVIHVDELSQEQFLFLRALQDEISVGEAWGRVAAGAGDEKGSRERPAFAWLLECVPRSYFGAIERA